VDDLRTLTQAETGQLRLELRPLDLGELAGHAIDLFEVDAADKDIRLTLTTEAGLPAVLADPQRLGQVIGNLLSNSLRYTPPSGQVEVRACRVDNVVEFSISDTGPGVLEDDLPHLFDRFWRAEKARTRATGGSGLGLAIVKQLIETQQGTLLAQNLASGGLRVAFQLPIAASARPGTL
jgi:signal transduction histidine kinase